MVSMPTGLHARLLRLATAARRATSSVKQPAGSQRVLPDPARRAVQRLAAPLRDAQIGTKVVAMVLVTSSIFVVVGVLGIRQTNNLSARTENLHSQKVAGLEMIARLRAIVGDVQTMSLVQSFSPEDSDSGTRQRLIEAEDAKVQQQLAALRAIEWSAERREQLERFAQEYVAWQTRRDASVAAAKFAVDDTSAAVTANRTLSLSNRIVANIDGIFAELVKDVGASAAAAKESAQESQRLMSALLAAGVLIAIALALLAARAISRPLKRTVQVLKGVAEGDLTQQLDVTTHDEVGQMGEALNQAIKLLRSTLCAIGDNVTTLAGASEELAVVSSSMSESAEETSTQAVAASSAAEEVSASVQTVAVAAEELGASIREVARHALTAAGIAESGAAEARDANRTVTELSESSMQIEQIVGLITSIAGQTHLLALNARIEAERAGEAGLGFAVVATEVKDLAKQTAGATGEVGRAVGEIQIGSHNAADAIVRIRQVIDTVNDNQGTIATAMEQQTTTTAEISANALYAADGSNEIARNISAVADAARTTSSGAQQTQNSAAELSRMAAELRGLVSLFRV